MIGKYPPLIRGVIRNLLSNLNGTQLTYVVEGRPWSIQQDGHAITHSLNTQSLLKAGISSTAIGLRNQIVHFGSINTFFNGSVPVHVHPSNMVVVTWFHIKPNDPRVRTFVEHQKNVDRVHTSCQATKDQLMNAGIEEHKVVVIPLGVDTDLFHPIEQDTLSAERARLDIPDNAFVIGSFQKDGEGWGEGMKPKHVKGPDVFIETIEQLKDLNPFVLLTGPSRGYVKQELDRIGVTYKHLYLKHFREVANLFRLLDVYLIPSRVEGGPKAILEGWASGVPVVSTRVGMIPDIATHEQDALIAESEDTTALAEHCRHLHGNTDLRNQLIQTGLERVSNFTWNSIANRYFNELYQPHESQHQQ